MRAKIPFPAVPGELRLGQILALHDECFSNDIDRSGSIHRLGLSGGVRLPGRESIMCRVQGLLYSLRNPGHVLGNQWIRGVQDQSSSLQPPQRAFEALIHQRSLPKHRSETV